MMKWVIYFGSDFINPAYWQFQRLRWFSWDLAFSDQLGLDSICRVFSSFQFQLRAARRCSAPPAQLAWFPPSLKSQVLWSNSLDVRSEEPGYRDICASDSESASSMRFACVLQVLYCITSGEMSDRAILKSKSLSGPFECISGSFSKPTICHM